VRFTTKPQSLKVGEEFWVKIPDGFSPLPLAGSIIFTTGGIIDVP